MARKTGVSISHNRTALYWAILLIILLAIAIVYLSSSDVGNRGGLVGDPVCGNFVSEEDQNECCAQGHKGEVTVQCVGNWEYVSGIEKCQFVCEGEKPRCEGRTHVCGYDSRGNPYFVKQNPLKDCEFDDCPKIAEDEESSCSIAGGEWREFSNSCVDSCDLERNPEVISCLQALTFGCDCGSDRCWNGISCELN